MLSAAPALAPRGVIGDSAGNTLQTARNLGPITGARVYTESVGSFDQNDFYRFNTRGTGPVTVRIDNMTADADLEIRNASGQVIDSAAAGGNAPDQVTVTSTGPTLFYIRVYQFRGDTGYRMTVTAPTNVDPGGGGGGGGGNPVPDAAGNTPQTARNLGPITGSQTATDFVGAADTNDYYRFQTAAAGTIAVTVTGLTGNADVQLRDASGTNILRSGTATGNTSESITHTSNLPGTFFVRVYPTDADTNYTVTVTFTPAGGGGGGGTDNTPQTARNLGLVAGTRTVTESVSTTDPLDFYRFQTAAGGLVRATLNGFGGNANLQLLDANGTVLQQSNNGGTTADVVNFTAPSPGAYFIRVNNVSATTTYSLSVAAPAGTGSPTPTPTPPPNDGAGNTLATARQLGTLTSNQSYTDFVGTADPNDLYRFSTNSAGSIRVDLTGLAADAHLELLDGQGRVIRRSARTGTEAEALLYVAANPGTYYIHVVQGSGDTNYTLNVTLN